MPKCSIPNVQENGNLLDNFFYNDILNIYLFYGIASEISTLFFWNWWILGRI